MGNTLMKWVPSFLPTPSDTDLDYYQNEGKNLKNEDSHDHVHHDYKVVDSVNIINFMEKNGVDVNGLKRTIADVQITRCNPVIHDALLHVLTSLSIKEMKESRKLAVSQSTDGNLGSQKQVFDAHVDVMIGTAKDELATFGVAAPVRSILVCLFQNIKKVNFFTSACQTKGQSFGIVDIIHVDETIGTVLFDLVKVEVKMINQNNEVVSIGGKKVYVVIDIYYARASMELPRPEDTIGGEGDTLQLINFLASQGQDVTVLKRLIGGMLKKPFNDNAIHTALQKILCLNRPFKVPFILNDPIPRSHDIVTYGIDMKFGNAAGDIDTFNGKMESLLAKMSIASLSDDMSDMLEEQKNEFYDMLSKAGVIAMGTIVKKLLEGIQKVNFFETSCVCESNGYLDRQIGIIDITGIQSSSSNDPIIGFGVAYILFRMFSEKEDGKLVFVGGPKVEVDVHAFYTPGSITLKDLIPEEEERKKVMADIRKKMADAMRKRKQ